MFEPACPADVIGSLYRIANVSGLFSEQGEDALTLGGWAIYGFDRAVPGMIVGVCLRAGKEKEPEYWKLRVFHPSGVVGWCWYRNGDVL